MAFHYFSPTETEITGERTYLTAALAVGGTALTVKNTNGFSALQVTLTTLTSSITTATATKAAHGFTDGDWIVISGATQTEYNGTYQITVTGTSTFTYTFAGSVTTPATGTILATRQEFILLGTIGEETSEIVTASAVTTATAMTAGASLFAHAVNDGVYDIFYNKKRLYGCATSGGTYVLIETQDVQVDNPQGNYFIYNGATYSYFKIVYYNSIHSTLYPALVDATILQLDEKKFYATIAGYKAYKGITNNDYDGQIQALIETYTAVINNYLYGDSTSSLFSTTYTEDLTVGIRDWDVIITKRGPISSVTSIAIDNNIYYSSTVNTLAIDGFSGYFIYVDGTVPGGSRGYRLPIQVVYTAGYTTIPADIQLAMYKLISRSLDPDVRDNSGISQFSIGSKTVVYDTSSTTDTTALIPSQIKAILAPYRKTRIATAI